MKVLGLTGDIACGKSTVGRLLTTFGAVHLDADELVRELYANATFSAKMAQVLGDEILDVAGFVDKEKLRAQVWGQSRQSARLKQLESLVFPAVAELRREKLELLRAQGFDVAVVEAVKLLESGQGRGCAEIWCVVARSDVQMRRLMDYRGLDERGARARLEAQPSRERKRELAEQVPLVWIENDGSLAELEARVAREWERLNAQD